jgi:hypothetical protein
LKNNNNILIRYTGDGLLNYEANYHKLIKNLDGIIVGSYEFKDYLEKENINSKIEVLPANHDYFLNYKKYESERNSKFSLFFGGSKDVRGYPIQGELGLNEKFNYNEGYFHSLKYMFENMKGESQENLEKYVFNIAVPGKCYTLNTLIDSQENPSRYSCHYAVRSPIFFNNLGHVEKYEQWVTKTGGKVSTAAASGANIITSLDPSVRVLIDESYPYAIDTEHPTFLDNYQEICTEMFIKARETFNTKVWFEGLKILEKVKQRTTTKRIVEDYVNFGNTLYDLS